MADIGFGQFARRIHADQERRSAFMSAPERPAPADPNARTFGFRSGAAAPLPAPGTPGGSLMGTPPPPAERTWEPTAFKAGAGAPAPAEVIRGSRMTFTNPVAADAGGGYTPQPGRGTQEFGTSLEAGQAYNRGMAGAATTAADQRGFTDPTIAARYGEARVPGQTLAETAASKEPPSHGEAWRAQAGMFKAQEEGIRQTQEKARIDANTKAFDQLMHESSYSTFDTGTGKGVFKAKDEGQYRDYLASKKIGEKDPQAGRQHFEERQMVRQWLQTQPLAPNTNIDAMLDAGASNPEHWQGLVADARKVVGVTKPTAPAHWYDRFRSAPTPGTNLAPLDPTMGVGPTPGSAAQYQEQIEAERRQKARIQEELSGRTEPTM